MRKIPKLTRENQLNSALSGTPFKFVKWAFGFENNKSSVTVNCPKHGDWSAAFNSLIRTKMCPKCVIASRVADINKTCSRINQNLKIGQSLVGPIGEYTSNLTKFRVICDIHGEWSASALHLIHSGTGCRRCAFDEHAMRRRTPKREVVDKLVNYKFKKGWSFVKLLGDYSNSRSKLVMNCVDHGDWVTDINTVITNKAGCLSCSKNGYDKNIPATLYVLRSRCGLYFKAGISNSVKRRITELRRTTPFDFEPIAKINHNGEVVFELEKAFHLSFESAQMKGFGGCTEWFKWDASVNDWVSLLTR